MSKMTEDVKKKNDRDDVLDHWSTAIKMFLHPRRQTNHKDCRDTRIWFPVYYPYHTTTPLKVRALNPAA
jgi:hypothetical protein